MSVDREHPVLVGAIVYRLSGGRGRVEFPDFGTFCDALEVYDLETEEAYHISCDIEDYYEQDLRK